MGAGNSIICFPDSGTADPPEQCHWRERLGSHPPADDKTPPPGTTSHLVDWLHASRDDGAEDSLRLTFGSGARPLALRSVATLRPEVQIAFELMGHCVDPVTFGSSMAARHWHPMGSLSPARVADHCH